VDNLLPEHAVAYGRRMPSPTDDVSGRWDRFFADLESQADGLDRAELEADVADRLRAERAVVRLVDRLRSRVGAPVTLWPAAGEPVHGTVREVGRDWFLLDGDRGRAHLAPLHAVIGVDGLGHAVVSAGHGGLALTVVLRGISRDRGQVTVRLSGGGVVTGRIDRVWADHLDLTVPAGPTGGADSGRVGSVVRSIPAAAAVLFSLPSR
jgi:hypothetical protein